MSNDYPRMLYADDGRTHTAYSEAEENELSAEWSRQPSDIHRAIRVHGDVNVSPENEALADMIAARVFDRLKALLEPAEPVKRGPGRPKASLD